MQQVSCAELKVVLTNADKENGTRKIIQENAFVNKIIEDGNELVLTVSGEIGIIRSSIETLPGVQHVTWR